MQVAGYICDNCGADDLLNIRPGRMAEHNDLFLICEPDKPVALCRKCFMFRYAGPIATPIATRVSGATSGAGPTPTS